LDISIPSVLSRSIGSAISQRSSDIEYPGCGAAGLTEGCGVCERLPIASLMLYNDT